MDPNFGRQMDLQSARFDLQRSFTQTLTTAEVENGGAIRGADGQTPNIWWPPVDAGLATLLIAWPDLPAVIKAGILAMVEAAGNGPERGK